MCVLCINPQNTREFHFFVSLSSLCVLSLSLSLLFFALALQSPNSYRTRTVRLSGQLSIASIFHSYCIYSSSLFLFFFFLKFVYFVFVFVCLCYFCTVQRADLSPKLTLLCTKSRVFIVCLFLEYTYFYLILSFIWLCLFEYECVIIGLCIAEFTYASTFPLVKLVVFGLILTIWVQTDIQCL